MSMGLYSKQSKTRGGKLNEVASFPVPRPAFRHLQYVACSTASDKKLGVGLGTRQGKRLMRPEQTLSCHRFGGVMTRNLAV